LVATARSGGDVRYGCVGGCYADVIVTESETKWKTNSEVFLTPHLLDPGTGMLNDATFKWGLRLSLTGSAADLRGLAPKPPALETPGSAEAKPKADS